MRGRKPKPPELRLLQGNPGHRPIQDIPKPIPGQPPCPDYLTGVAREVWYSVISEMSAAGTLGMENTRTIERYVVLYARWREAEAHVAQHGAVVPAPRSSVPMPNPNLAVANAASDRLGKIEAELGLTPSSRARVARPATQSQHGVADSPWLRLKAMQQGLT